MKFMECTCCKTTVLVNNTGTCLSCQSGFTGVKGKDAWISNSIDDLKKKQQEIEDATKKRV